MIIQFIFDTTRFIANFIIGPSITEGMRTSLQTRFFISPETLLEGFLVFAGEYATRSRQLVLSERINMAQCAKAIAKLRSLRARNIPEVRTLLAMGTCILTYDQLAAIQGSRMSWL
ncbi:hypothetical protein PENFLA_c010G04556 [Penicillium flavigenum]|uniref:Uncharacterized protein n=1 Tax=Penicillium flavigenum TaxID=254877 RepID=A0A1V6TCW5_9EURO|nr:hypothetical protein PENFLA_c010G04556 [Penicillium flavigenum]